MVSRSLCRKNLLGTQQASGHICLWGSKLILSEVTAIGVIHKSFIVMSARPLDLPMQVIALKRPCGQCLPPLWDMYAVLCMLNYYAFQTTFSRSIPVVVKEDSLAGGIIRVQCMLCPSSRLPYVQTARSVACATLILLNKDPDGRFLASSYQSGIHCHFLLDVRK